MKTVIYNYEILILKIVLVYNSVDISIKDLIYNYEMLILKIVVYHSVNIDIGGLIYNYEIFPYCQVKPTILTCNSVHSFPAICALRAPLSPCKASRHQYVCMEVKHLLRSFRNATPTRFGPLSVSVLPPVIAVQSSR